MLIFFFSCSTGKPKKRLFDYVIEKITGIKQKGDPFNNIAQVIADKAKRVVIAPMGDVTSSYTAYVPDDGASLYHPLEIPKRSDGQSVFVRIIKLLFQPNSFQAFRPRFKECSPIVNKEKLTEKELAVEAAIKADLISKGCLHRESSFMEEYFKHCKADPRESVLVFSDYDDNEGLYSQNFVEILSRLADEKDFSFHQIKSPEDACYIMKVAAQQKKIASIIFIGTKGSKGLLLSKDERGNEMQMDSSMNFKNCLSGVAEDGKIIFIGGSIGEGGENENNIPQRVANVTKKIVEATTYPVFFRQY